MKPLWYYKLKGKLYNIGVIWDKLAPTKGNAIEFAHKYINPEPQRMINEFKYSLEYCLAHTGENINDRFRKNRPDELDLEIADLISKNKTQIPHVLYRGVCKEVFQQMQRNARGMEGVDLHEKSFLQTSLVKGQESKQIIRLRIYVPVGTEAIYLGNVNDEQFYYEVDIQHGSKLKVISMDDVYINCELIGRKDYGETI